MWKLLGKSFYDIFYYALQWVVYVSLNLEVFLCIDFFSPRWMCYVDFWWPPKFWFVHGSPFWRRRVCSKCGGKWQPTLKRICGCWSLENQWCSRSFLPSMCILVLNNVSMSSWWWGIRLCASILISMVARVSILQSYVLYISFLGHAWNSFNPNMLRNPHITKWQPASSP